MKKNLLKFLGLCLTLAVSLVPATRSYANVDQVAANAGQLAVSAMKLGGTVASTSNQSWVSTTTTMLDLYYTGSASAAYITIASGGSGSGNSCLFFYAPFGTADTSIGSATCGATGGAFDLGASTVATLGQYGLGPVQGVPDELVTAKLRETIDILRGTFPSEQVGPVLVRLRAVWSE